MQISNLIFSLVNLVPLRTCILPCFVMPMEGLPLNGDVGGVDAGGGGRREAGEGTGGEERIVM